MTQESVIWALLFTTGGGVTLLILMNSQFLTHRNYSVQKGQKTKEFLKQRHRWKKLSVNSSFKRKILVAC